MPLVLCEAVQQKRNKIQDTSSLPEIHQQLADSLHESLLHQAKFGKVSASSMSSQPLFSMQSANWVSNSFFFIKCYTGVTLSVQKYRQKPCNYKGLSLFFSLIFPR